MNKYLLLLALLFVQWANGQDLKGKIVSDYITSASLQNNAGENTTRKLTIYLPPEYNETTNRYPVIYYLHAFTETDSLSPARVRIIDMAISTGKIRPMILVISDQRTTFDGSLYSNSSWTGNWADFTAKDVVAYIDAHYRTIASRDGRAVGGHSMGGYGAIKMGMLFPEVFCCVYAMSPAPLGLVKEMGPNSDSYKQLAAIKTTEELQKSFFHKVLADMARTWSPNPSKPPFYGDVPFQYVGDSMVVDQAVLAKWNMNMPVNMSDKYLLNLGTLKAFKMDWGRKDSGRITALCGMFSQRLEDLGVVHYAEEYIGNHTNKIWTEDGRVLNEMLPFFNTYLTFENQVFKKGATK